MCGNLEIGAFYLCAKVSRRIAELQVTVDQRHEAYRTIAFEAGKRLLGIVGSRLPEGPHIDGALERRCQGLEGAGRLDLFDRPFVAGRKLNAVDSDQLTILVAKARREEGREGSSARPVRLPVDVADVVRGCQCLSVGLSQARIFPGTIAIEQKVGCIVGFFEHRVDEVTIQVEHKDVVVTSRIQRVAVGGMPLLVYRMVSGRTLREVQILLEIGHVELEEASSRRSQIRRKRVPGRLEGPEGIAEGLSGDVLSKPLPVGRSQQIRLFPPLMSPRAFRQPHDASL
mmetsp:Transcript_12250/g.29213  ORF Transcript_12250/g.29213 Transcript_12250/m.29213 type:complete len:285 (+) Transcript_12250:491-1345(+)